MAEAGGGEGGSGPSLGCSSTHMDILTAQVLLKKGKRYAAKYLRDECLRNLSPKDSLIPRTQVLGELLDLLLNPAMRIKNWDTIDWLKWLMAAGRTPDDFFNTGTVYMLQPFFHYS
nr:E3 ubiquitin-protein ligase Ubr3-like [Procambarus clarkii]XP_045608710.1 E3 ubiquitin-protein ligase Ubr3-like [Procambarus clarkii]XP_045608712.1 E3 ubiquitin-protein ligase Ubr3-like [Procambarus clarkii]XP_045608713.1 E3 ubiquitin-protein ligase Ubr3-like [Procambarus clarkii]